MIGVGGDNAGASTSSDGFGGALSAVPWSQPCMSIPGRRQASRSVVLYARGMRMRRLVAGPDAGEAAVECSVWANLTAWRSPVWSHSSSLLMILSSPSRSILCRCLLSVAVFWTGRKQDVIDHWPCAGSSVGVELRAFLLMPNDGRLATQQTHTLHLIITDILHVTKFLT